MNNVIKKFMGNNPPKKHKMRKLPYITVGVILLELKDEIKRIVGEDASTISRTQFYKLEEEGLFMSERTAGDWRVYTRAEAEIIKRLILEHYKIIERTED